jgi:glutathione S-transferase
MGRVMRLFQFAALPMGQVPVLYIDDKPFAQSGTIYRYIAQNHGNVELCSTNIVL